MQHVVLTCLAASCSALAGVVVSPGNLNAARYELAPEEATLLLIYGIAHNGLRRTAGAYVVDGKSETVAGQISPTVMRVKRNLGCRVEIETSTVDEVDPGTTIVETAVYDWTKVLVDQITVSQVTVPTVGDETYYITIKVPGPFIGTRVVRGTSHGVETVQSGEPTGLVEFRWPYAPGQPNAYQIRRQPFVELMERCTGRALSLPEATGASVPLRGIVP